MANAPAALETVRRGAGVLYRAARFEARAFVATPLSLVVCVVQPGAFILIVLAVGAEMPPEEATRRLIGVALLSIWAMVIWSSGSILRRDRQEGTLTALLLSTRVPFMMVLARSAGAIVTGSAVMGATVVVAMLALGVDVVIRSPLWFAVAVLLAMASATGLGMLMSTLFVATRAADRISEALLYPLFVLGGILVPLDLLPELLRLPSVVVSMRWGAQAAFEAAATGSADVLALSLTAGLGAAYLAAGIVMFNRVIERSRRHGDLELT